MPSLSPPSAVAGGHHEEVDSYNPPCALPEQAADGKLVPTNKLPSHGSEKCAGSGDLGLLCCLSARPVTRHWAVTGGHHEEVDSYNPPYKASKTHPKRRNDVLGGVTTTSHRIVLGAHSPL